MSRYIRPAVGIVSVTTEIGNYEITTIKMHKKQAKMHVLYNKLQQMHFLILF